METQAAPRKRGGSSKRTDDGQRAAILGRIAMGERGCWEWIGARDGSGYGMMKRGRAHRESYRVFVGPIPEGMCVLHRCDVPPCVNPEHLWIGTKSDNARDREAKGRGRDNRGERHPMAKLAENDIIDIRTCFAFGATRATLAKEFSVSLSRISAILNNQSWVQK